MSRRLIALLITFMMVFGLTVQVTAVESSGLLPHPPLPLPDKPIGFDVIVEGPGEADVAFAEWEGRPFLSPASWNIEPDPDDHAYLVSMRLLYKKHVFPHPFEVLEGMTEAQQLELPWIQMNVEYPGNPFSILDVPDFPNCFDIKVKLTFADYKKLTVTKTGNGASYGTVDVTGAEEQDGDDWYFMPDATAGLTADPVDVRNHFDGWSEDLSGSANPETLVMSEDREVTATFLLEEYAVNLVKIGLGDGELFGPGSVPAYAEPSVMASPDMYSLFKGWYEDEDAETQLTWKKHYTLPPVETDVTLYGRFEPRTFSFQKWIRPLDIPEQSLPPIELDAMALRGDPPDDLVIPEDGQFTFTLTQLVQPARDGPVLKDLLIQYVGTASNDAEGWVTFWPDPAKGMYLLPGLYVLTEEDDPNDAFEPCTIPEGGLVVQLFERGGFRFLGPYEQQSEPFGVPDTEEAAELACRKPQYVINCEIPKPGLAIDKKAEGSDGPVSVYINEQVDYTIRVSNTGNVTLSDIMMVDDRSPDSPYGPFELGPMSYRDFDYHLSYGSVGTYVNTATVSATWMTPIFKVLDEEGNGLPEPSDGIEVGPVSDSVTVEVNRRPTTTTTTRTSTPRVNLTVTVEGPGTALPASGSYSLGSLVNMSATPDAGALFDGWFGTNGAEISGGQLLMNADKSVIARFSVPIPVPVIPEAAPEVVPEPVIAEPVVQVPVVMPVEEEVPLAAPELPKTAGLPLPLLLVSGGALLATGFWHRKKTRK